MSPEALSAGRNVVPSAYRGVAVAEVDCPLDEPSLIAHLVGREAYRRTRFIVARKGSDTAVVAVEKASEDPLFAPITSATMLAHPNECAYVRRPDLDTAVPTHLARAAAQNAPGKRGVVVEGAYGHVSFIIDPAPLRLTVRDVAPPFPPKLVDQVKRLLDVAEHLPPIELVPDVLDLAQLARRRPSETYLFPCRGGGVTVDGATLRYLDQRPERLPWTLVGCERSQQIHEWVYRERAEQVDMCPCRASSTGGPLLTKCCLLEREIAVGETQVVVPWGASLGQIAEALAAVTNHWEPSWAPV